MAGTLQIRGIGQSHLSATYAGTAATLNLDLGFIPISARALNVTDGDAGWTWFRGMDSAMCITEVSTLASVTSAGVTILDGSAGNGIGLTLGGNTTVNESGKTYVVVFER